MLKLGFIVQDEHEERYRGRWMRVCLYPQDKPRPTEATKAHKAYSMPQMHTGSILRRSQAVEKMRKLMSKPHSEATSESRSRCIESHSSTCLNNDGTFYFLGHSGFAMPWMRTGQFKWIIMVRVLDFKCPLFCPGVSSSNNFKSTYRLTTG